MSFFSYHIRKILKLTILNRDIKDLVVALSVPIHTLNVMSNKMARGPDPHSSPRLLPEY